MTDHERQIIIRINKYAENVLADIDPQRTRTGFQIAQLMPIIRDIAKEEGITEEEMFIKYMDLQTEFKLEEDRKFRDDMDGISEELL